MTLKANALEAVEVQAKLYHDAQDALNLERDALLVKMRTAKAAGASQQEIADKVGITRQRVSQFLQGK